MSNQDIRQAADANTHQLESLEAEAVEVEAEAEEVDFTPIGAMEEMVAETVMVVAMTVTMTITVMMILKMLMDTLQICVVTTYILLLLHRLLLHLHHLRLI